VAKDTLDGTISKCSIICTDLKPCMLYCNIYLSFVMIYWNSKDRHVKYILRTYFLFFLIGYISRFRRPSWWNNYGQLLYFVAVSFIVGGNRRTPRPLQLHFEFSLELSYTSSEHKLELVQPISFSPSSQKIVYLSHLEFLRGWNIATDEKEVDYLLNEAIFN
jgi:hypothetical protein